ncbi:hypothetical protein [Hymenobacter psychrophilus]|uniref:Uncharacterized protein n=1 Tax=Hymenobacter psychrophilus TaxID=651662 RepID=A0A1H3PJH8_9BACT|nr:hypothetical protein [Hymenobacter psychrophilus]SDZ01230.1 hypothetical protein SAMN04488069_1357 [Hymenobacter psychrophilus]
MTTEQAADHVNEWVANNPERLDYCYDKPAAFLSWKQEAAKRAAAGESLELWADEAECKAAFKAMRKDLGWTLADVAAITGHTEGSIKAMVAQGFPRHLRLAVEVWRRMK